MGLTALQFDVTVVALIAAAALAVWLFVFNGTATARDYLGLEKSPPFAVSQQSTAAAISAQQPAPGEAQPPADVAPPAQPSWNDLLVSSAQALNEVQSFRGRFQMTMSMNGKSVNSGGDMLFQAPNKMHMTMNIDGQSFEMLALHPRIFVRIPHQGWYVLDGQAMGLSPQSLSDYLSNRGLIDYQAEARLLSGLVQLPDEEIDGVPYVHLQGTLNFEDLVKTLPPEFFDPSEVALAAPGVSGPVNVDVLLDQSTNLPRRYTMTVKLDANGSLLSMDVRMAFNEFNGTVTIPDAPEDARPFDSLAIDSPPPQID